nr:piggyBac transposable element-derived protein 4-like [Penaeus vannamei]
MLSTVQKSRMVQTHPGSRRMKPRCVVEYNAGMKGVDLGDQLAASYHSVRSLKWYKLFFNYDLAVINTFSVYKLLGHARVDQADFRMDLAMDIRNHFVPQKEPFSRRGRPSSLPSPARIAGGTSHPVRKIPSKKYRRCFPCYCAGKRKMARSTCGTCQVALSTYGCFERYHSPSRL